MTIRLRSTLHCVVVLLLLMLSANASAQEATLSGTVTDITGGVLPGVTVVAVHETTGNSYTSVTDGTGRYRMAVRTGVYRLTAELDGFATITRAGWSFSSASRPSSMCRCSHRRCRSPLR
jgi:Carboxypeptidase regulatory-like domain